MGITESLENRRSYYNIKKEMPVEEERVVSLIEKLTELVPDAFNMKSARVVIALGDKQEQLWDGIYNVFEGKVPREKIDSFRSGAGTVLYFYDKSVVSEFQKNFPRYAENFAGWAGQANGMLQLSIWSGLRELGIGASLQHYNPVIDARVRELFDLPESYELIAQMPFGGIVAEPEAKEKENMAERVKVMR